MKKIFTICLIATSFICKAQLNNSNSGDNTNSVEFDWSFIEHFLDSIDDIEKFTVYYTLDGKEIDKKYNTPMVTYYRGVRRRVIIFKD